MGDISHHKFYVRFRLLCVGVKIFPPFDCVYLKTGYIIGEILMGISLTAQTVFLSNTISMRL